MNKSLLTLATILGILAIILGAYAAHGLKALISAESLNIFETGVRYQFYHAFFLFVVGLTPNIKPQAQRIIMYVTLIGVLFFSGSIYGLATNNLWAFDFKTIAFITPIGGLFLIAAWLTYLSVILKLKNR